MKLIKKTKAAHKDTESVAPPWKVLIVDDEQDVHEITRLNVKRLRFAGRGLELLSALSAEQAKAILRHETDIAVALVDVVMETDNAGLELVNFIREELGNNKIRLIIRTGQPGAAPEREVIDHYDIDDYKDKTELTAQRLYTSLRTALKAYHDLRVIDRNRQGLEYILDATPGLYMPQVESLDGFFRGVLMQVIALCRLGNNSVISSINGIIGTLDKETVHIQAGTGDYADKKDGGHLPELLERCSRIVLDSDSTQILQHEELPPHSLLLPLRNGDETLGFIFLENTARLNKDERHLLYVLTNQCAAAMQNLRLHLELKEANQESLYMLAIAAEFKDKTTGAHITRMAETIRLLALELGLKDKEARHYGQAGMLHDIGKLGVPDKILQKPARLNEEEFDIIRRHPETGVRILGRHPWFTLARDIAFGHHERWDGKGYPRGLKGEEISLACRITSVADVFDALYHERPYKAAWSLDDVLSEIKSCSGKQFDPQVVAALLRLIEKGKLPLRIDADLISILPED